MDGRRKKTKSQLLEWTRKIYPTPKSKIQKLADKFTRENFEIKVLFLPVAHPELNPIEMVWSLIKRYVASKKPLFSALEDRRAHRRKNFIDNCTKYLKKLPSILWKKESSGNDICSWRRRRYGNWNRILSVVVGEYELEKRAWKDRLVKSRYVLQCNFHVHFI